MSFGLVKVGNDYINPNHITHIGKESDGKTLVMYDTLAQGPKGVGPTSDRIPVDSDKFAQCVQQAGETGKIVDVYA